MFWQLWNHGTVESIQFIERSMGERPKALPQAVAMTLLKRALSLVIQRA